MFNPRLFLAGPSLCDDVLGLLRLVLVEDHVRPGMRALAGRAAEVLQRHSHLVAAAGEAAGTGTDADAIAAAEAEAGAVQDGGEDATVQEAAGGASGGTCGEGKPQVPSRPCSGLLPRLNPAALQPLRLDQLAWGGGAGSVCADQAPSASLARLDEEDLLQLDGGGDGGNAGADGVAGCGGGRAVSLFDMCAPLVTARGGRPMSRSWQRFLSKP